MTSSWLYNMLYDKRPLLEALLWVIGIGAMGFMDPEGKHLFSLCPISWTKVGFCPGCGLGHAVAHLFRGNLLASWEAHPLGLPLLGILVWRVVSLCRHYLFLKSFYLTHNH